MLCEYRDRVSQKTNREQEAESIEENGDGKIGAPPDDGVKLSVQGEKSCTKSGRLRQKKRA